MKEKEQLIPIENSEFATLYDMSLFTPILTRDGIGSVINQLKGLEDIIFLPTYVGKLEGAYGFTTELKGKDIIALNEELFKIEDINKRTKFIALVLAHEALHIRLRHMKRFSEYLRKYPFITNVVMDLYINHIVDQLFNGRIDDDIWQNVFSFRNFGKVKKVLGLDIDSKNLLDVDKMKEMDEDELLNYFLQFAEKLADEIQQLIEQAIDNMQKNQNNNNNQQDNSNGNQQGENSDNENSGNGNSDNGNSGNSEENQGENDNENEGNKENNNQGDNEGEDNNSSNGTSDNNNSGNIGDKLSDLAETIEQITQEVANKLRDKAKNDKELKKQLDNVGQFGPVEGFIRQMVKDMLNPPGEPGEGEDNYNREKLKEFVENFQKIKGNSGSFFRSVLVNKQKIPIPSFVLKLFNRLEKNGYLRRRIVYPNKHVKSNVILGKRKFFGMEMNAIVDTSGSISQEELDKFIKILAYMIEQGVQFNIYFNDTQYQEVRGIDSIQKLKKVLKADIIGGGGSVFNQVFEENKSDYGLLFTDLYIDGLEVLPRNFAVVVTKDHDKHNLNEIAKTNYVILLEDLL